MLSGKRRRLRAYADDDSPLIVQDLNLLNPVALEFRHVENATPNGFEVGRQVALAAQPRAISADQAEFVIRHGASSTEMFSLPETHEGIEGSAPDEFFRPSLGPE